MIMREEAMERPAVDGEWECDECGHIIPGRASKPPKGPCPECGEPADNSFTFFAYDDNWDADWDDDTDE
jgi:rubrerythrin